MRYCSLCNNILLLNKSDLLYYTCYKCNVIRKISIERSQTKFLGKVFNYKEKKRNIINKCRTDLAIPITTNINCYKCKISKTFNLVTTRCSRNFEICLICCKCLSLFRISS